jgi:DNA topoisomerase II
MIFWSHVCSAHLVSNSIEVLDQMDLAEEVQREKRIKEGKKGGSKAAPKKQPKKAAPIKLESSTEGIC